MRKADLDLGTPSYSPCSRAHDRHLILEYTKTLPICVLRRGGFVWRRRHRRREGRPAYYEELGMLSLRVLSKGAVGGMAGLADRRTSSAACCQGLTNLWWNGCLTKRASAQASIRSSIWWCSWLLTAPGGVYKAVSHSPSRGCRSATARLTTAHQIGTVFDSASGIRLPDLVESTRIALP